MTIEIRHLQTLQAIADTGSLTRAAKRRNLTLSAVSHLVRELETLLGIELLDRRVKPIALTAAGSRLLVCAEAVLPLVASAEADLARLSGERRARLHLALECHSCFDWLLPALDTLREAWPELDLDLRLGPRFDPIPALLAGEVDAVLGTDRVDHPGLHYDGVFRYEIVLVTPKDHRLAKKRWLQPEDLLGEPFVTYPVDLERLDVVTRFLRPAGVEPVRARTAELTTILLQMVRSGRGVAALPRWAVVDSKNAGDLTMVRLGQRGLHSELFLAVRAEAQQEPHLVAFLEVARKTSRELLAEIEPIAESAQEKRPPAAQ
jgi:LysR family transcriptional regulator for metE and metH